MPAVFLPLFGLALGATAMFVLDPVQGRRRRALLRDQLVSKTQQVRSLTRVAGRDIAHRARGAIAQFRVHSGASEVPDDRLVERVRARLGRFSSHPKAIEVSASEGRIVLTGPVLAAEHGPLVEAVRSVRGVKEVDDRLAVYLDAEGVPALQGASSLPGERASFMQRTWSPAARLLSGSAGGALVMYSIAHRGPLGLVALATGVAMLARAATNRPLAEMTHRRTQPRSDVHGPLEEARTISLERAAWSEV